MPANPTPLTTHQAMMVVLAIEIRHLEVAAAGLQWAVDCEPEVIAATNQLLAQLRGQLNRLIGAAVTLLNEPLAPGILHGFYSEDMAARVPTLTYLSEDGRAEVLVTMISECATPEHGYSDMAYVGRVRAGQCIARSLPARTDETFYRGYPATS